MRSCAIHVHKHSVEALLLQKCREVTMVILNITPWLPAYMGHSLIRCNKAVQLKSPPGLPPVKWFILGEPLQPTMIQIGRAHV